MSAGYRDQNLVMQSMFKVEYASGVSGSANTFLRRSLCMCVLCLLITFQSKNANLCANQLGDAQREFWRVILMFSTSTPIVAFCSRHHVSHHGIQAAT